MIDRTSSLLNCPRCGLSIRPKVSWLTVEHCPRCIARARIPVKLLSSTLSAGELLVRSREPRTVTTATVVRSR